MLQTNARLLAVHAAADSGDEAYVGAGGQGAAKWEAPNPAGAAPAYLRETRRRFGDAAGSNVTLDRLLLVDVGTPDVEYTVGDVVTFERLGVPGEESARVDIVQRPMISDPDIPADLITVRLTLAPA